MADQTPQDHAQNSNAVSPDKMKHDGCLPFLTKKEEKTEDAVMADLKEKKHTLLDELQRTHSHSSSSSDEEGERKKKKTKGLTEVVKDKLSGDKEGEDSGGGNAETEEKKGFLEKIIDKLPGHHKKGEEETQTPPAAAEHCPGSNGKENKGIIDKIKEKLPGQHKSNENEVKN